MSDIEYNMGKEFAEECFEYVLKTGKRCSGSSYYKMYVEVVAGSIRNDEYIPDYRMSGLKKILEHNGDFYRGVYDFLIEKVKEYKRSKNR